MKKADELIIDFGSASLGACISGSLEGRIELSQVSRLPIGTGSEETRANITAIANETLSTLLKQYQGVGKLNRIRVVLASPWYAARIRFVSSKAEKPVKVSRSSIERTVRDYKAKGQGSPLPGDIVESIITQVYVNGYPTALKKTVSGTTLRAHLYESAADRAFTDGIRGTLVKAFPGAAISFHSFPLVAFAVLRDIRDEENFMFIDAGGEVTDVAIVHRDSLRFLGSFPKGSLFFVRSISGGKGASDSIARISLFARGELSPSEAESFAKTFESTAAQWIADYQQVIASAQSDTAIPQTTFITADKEELRWFSKVLEGVHGAFPPRPILMSPDFFQKHISLGESASYDAFLSIESLYFGLPAHAFLHA